MYVPSLGCPTHTPYRRLSTATGLLAFALAIFCSRRLQALKASGIAGRSLNRLGGAAVFVAIFTLLSIAVVFRPRRIDDLTQWIAEHAKGWDTPFQPPILDGISLAPVHNIPLQPLQAPQGIAETFRSSLARHMVRETVDSKHILALSSSALGSPNGFAAIALFEGVGWDERSNSGALAAARGFTDWVQRAIPCLTEWDQSTAWHQLGTALRAAQAYSEPSWFDPAPREVMALAAFVVPQTEPNRFLVLVQGHGGGGVYHFNGDTAGHASHEGWGAISTAEGPVGPVQQQVFEVDQGDLLIFCTEELDKRTDWQSISHSTPEQIVNEIVHHAEITTLQNEGPFSVMRGQCVALLVGR